MPMFIIYKSALVTSSIIITEYDASYAFILVCEIVYVEMLIIK